MDKRFEQLAQFRPVNTSAIKLFNVADISPEPTEIHVKNFVITNTTGTDLEFSAFHDKDGTTYDESTALFFSTPIRQNGTVQQTVDLGMVSRVENFAIKSNLAYGLTFTLYGEVINK